ncbi:MAG: hypothetical protein MJA84_02890 [Firmicutes bacterium]|nr:hypothetical protein [Bacillota bacterium]
MKNLKIISLILTISFVFSTFFPTFVFAAKAPETNVTRIVENNQQIENRQESSAEIMGFKKNVIVFALRHGGEALDEIVGLISPKHGKYLKKHANEIADFLESISDSFEARLIDFMIFELGIPNSSARAIAWAICFVMI